MATYQHSEQHFLTPAVRWLAIVWLGAALLQATVVTPADLAQWLAFRPSQVTHAWWTPMSYAVLANGTWSLLLSLFALLVFGPRVERVWGTKAFSAFFLWCVAGGALTHAMFVRSGVLLGAEAGLFGVMLAYGRLWPNEELYLLGVLPMRVWTAIGVISGVMIGLAVSSGGPSGWGALAQLGGFGFAVLYLKRPNPAVIDELRHRMAPAPDPTDETPRAIPRTMPRARRGEEVDEIVAQSKAAVAKQSAPAGPTGSTRESRREAMNRLLDKISQQGLDSLTPEDRTLLEEMSRRLRDR
ncbi:MAG TPA: rhomboid family intramembrane serine protease [Gemmatimonadaceae bacterium]|nr:rhomboid family intramembrane serine protease [Gemmatimonadaceae bacterium]